jgi:hypothetical protein
MWQICYRIDAERYLSFSRGGGREAASDPNREWGLVVMSGRERDFAAEQRVRALPDFASRSHLCVVEGTEFPVLLEKDIDFAVDRVREAFLNAPQPAGS